VGQYRAKRYKRYRKTSEEKEEEDKIEEAYGIEWMDILLDIRNYKNKYNYILLTKKILEEIGINKPGIYKFTLETLNGEKIEVFREISKIKKHVIVVPKEYEKEKYLKLVDYEEYTLKKVINKIENFKKRRKIRYGLVKEDDQLYLTLGKMKILVNEYELRPFGSFLGLNLSIRATPYKETRLAIRLYDDSVKLYVKISRDTYIEVKEIKSTGKTAVLTYHVTGRGKLVKRHINILSPELYKIFSNLKDDLVINKFEYVRRAYRENYQFSVYRYVISDDVKGIIDTFLDYTYTLFNSGKSEDANRERENLGLIIAESFLKYLNFEKVILYSREKEGKGFDIIAVKNNETYLFEVKITEPSYRGFALKRGPHEIKEQVYRIYPHIVRRLNPPVKYIGAIIITYHYSWRPLNEYKIYLWVEKYEGGRNI